MISTSVHLGTHDHPTVEGHFREVMQQVMVEEEESPTLAATTSTIVLVASKTFLSEHLGFRVGAQALANGRRTYPPDRKGIHIGTTM